jgi:hypothetical protein
VVYAWLSGCRRQVGEENVTRTALGYSGMVTLSSHLHRIDGARTGADIPVHDAVAKPMDWRTLLPAAITSQPANI